ncbi:MAG: ABC transporter ATP-binding protein, partial [Candidatus Omnitrophica bacterium]|nr:ABC transporter ATP-binding protein [Candidatus Omnitrophota bacterium]
MPIVAFHNVWEMYRIKFVEDGKPAWENFWALKDVSFALEKGESLGIIGENGAGKSTILKLIAGMIKPDRGAVEVSGKVSGLLELGAGFQSELTGKENVYLNASMFGLSRAETDAVYADIADFADIGKFIHAPVKCYSQGMFVRLAFAIAVHVPSQILLIDDTLAVGDEHFQRKCLRKIFEFKEKGASVVFVTHDMHMLGRLCNRTLLLKEGRVLKDDAVERAVSLYTQTTGPREKVAHIEAGALALVCNEGRLFINWQGRLLTPGHGGHSAFLVAGAWLHSAQADWTITRESDSVIVAAGQFYQVPLRQVWRIELQEDRSIAWSIDLESPEGLKVQEGFVSIITGTEYAYWRTPCEKGEFSAFPQGANGWQDVLGREVSRKCLALVQGTDTPETPVMAFELLKSSGKNSAQILNGDEYTCGRMMRYRILSLSSGQPGEASREAFFSGRIRIAPADLDRYLAEREEHNFLSCGRLDVAFEAGGLKLS